MCTPTGGLINPGAFPVPTASPATLERQAGDLRREGAAVAGIGGDIKSAWAGLSSCYFAPEAETLYAVVDPVATDGDKVETSFGKAASALETFAEAVRDIKGKWSTLKTDSYAFLNSIEGDDDWREADGFVDSLLGRESDKVGEHQALLDRADALRREYEEAERACANAINADIPDRTSFVAGDGDGESAPGEFEHGYDGYLGDVAMAWGGPMETDHGWWVDAGAAVGDFFVGIAEDVGGVTGMYSSEGWFEMSWGDAMWEYHEGNLQSLGSLVGMYDSENDGWGWSGWDTVGNAWKDAAHAVVPWEEWGERPGYVIGTALLNIGATVGGAVLTATGVGAVVGVPLMAWRGSAMLNRMGGDGAPSAPDVDVPDMSRINLGLPRFGNVSLADLRIDLGQLREGAFSATRLSEMRDVLGRLTNGSLFGGGGDSPGGSGNGSGGDGDGNGSEGSQGSEGSNGQRVANQHGDEEGDPANTRPAVNPTTRQLDDSQELLELLTSRPDAAELGDTGRRVLGEQGGDTDASRPSRPGQSGLEDLDPSLEAVFNDMNAHASDYPAWEANQSPDGRVPALVGGGDNDTFEASEEIPNPPSNDRVDLTGTGDDGSGRFPDDHSDADTDNGGQEMRDRTPTVTNSTGDNDPIDGDGSSNNTTGGTDNHRTTQDSEASTSDQGRTTRVNVTGDLPGRPGHIDNADLPSQDQDVPGSRSDEGPDADDTNGNGEDRDAWNNESLDDRYRPPVVPEGNRTTIEPGTRGNRNEPGYPGPNSIFGSKGGLRANWLYELPGRGRFYTDDTGRITYVNTHAGEKGDRNPELKKPRPNVTYAVDVLENKGKKYFYETDDSSRTTHAQGDLQRVRSDEENGGLTLEEKNELYRAGDQGVEGRRGNQVYTGSGTYHRTDWDGGHFIGTGFGGSGHRLNLYAQLRELNQQVTGGTPETNFFALEREWRTALDSGRTVEVDFEAMYEGKSEIPKSIKVKYSIDGELQDPIVYHNQPDMKRGSTAARSYAERIAATTLGAALLAGVGGYEAEDDQSDLYAGADASGTELTAESGFQPQEMS